MSKLISIQGYIDKTFDPMGAPSPHTVRRWCVEGKIIAKKIGGIWFIVQQEEKDSTNDLVNKVLAG